MPEPLINVELPTDDVFARMNLYTSNRLENLAAQLAAALARPLNSPLTREVIVVQSRGMARWVSLQIARISKICMNCEFPFPREFVWRTLRTFFPEIPPQEEFSVEVMTWKINRVLPEVAPQEEFSLVKKYLDKEDAVKTLQLSQKIAGLFDQYLVYRPEMLMRWERDPKENNWQAILWRIIVGEDEPWHLARMQESLSQRMASPPESRLPERVSIFGVSSLPPLYLRIFIELSRQCEVNLFSLDPSQEYHGGDLSPKMRAKLLNRLALSGAKISEDVLPAGNPLLVSLGKLSRDFTEVRLELDERAGFVTRDQPGQFIEPDGKDMLHILQGDILYARKPDDPHVWKHEVSVNDGSIQVHACHSPLREMEVLYDHLLECFERDPTLQPRDIIVMAPNVEQYGPFIHAVFAYPEVSQRHIPFSVADRRPPNDSPTIEAFLSLLALAGSRCTASEIFALLEKRPIRRKFAFTDGDLILIRQWITESGIRWGIDAAHRKAFQLPELEANTWRTGLKRCLLGYAMAGGNQTMFEGVLPYDGVEAGSAEVLGRFITAAEALFSLALNLPARRPLAEWPDALSAVIEQFFLADTAEEFADLRIVRMALDRLRRTAELAGQDRQEEFRVVRYYLEALLDQSEQRGGFLIGGVTFCALQPMRSIPARVICLVGMGDRDFPRESHALGFDLMARERKCGDHSVRDDDKYTFLEALISARQRLYISYVGRSVIDNEEMPPSVLVSELLDYLDQVFVFPQKENAREWVVTEHRLHSFSPRYFDGKAKRLFSYSEANAAASRSLHMVLDQSSPGFFAKPLSEPGEEARRVELRNLIDFFSNPAKCFMRSRLRLRLEQEDDRLKDNEPFELSALESYLLKQELVAHALAYKRINVDQFAARGDLTSGEMGRAHFQELFNAAEEFRKRVESELRGEKRDEPLLVDMQIGKFSLAGQIESIYGGRIVRFRCASLILKDLLGAWINHLAKCVADSGAARETLLIGIDTAVTFLPPEDAQGLIAKLLEIYWRGLSRALPFFPESAMKYACAKLFPSPGARSLAFDKARRVWHGSKWDGEGEKNDRYYAFCFPPDRDPLDEEFRTLALEVFEPMLRMQSRENV